MLGVLAGEWEAGLLRSVGVSEEGSVVSMTTNENNVVTVSTNNNTIFGWDLRYTTTLYSTHSIPKFADKKDNATEQPSIVYGGIFSNEMPGKMPN